MKEVKFNNEQILTLIHSMLGGNIEWYGETNHDNEANDRIPQVGDLIFNLLNELEDPLLSKFYGHTGNGSAEQMNKIALVEFENLEEEVKRVREELDSYKEKE